jgi:nucleotidyltransferase/DNA polymerase involved in DNA repair
MIAGDSAILRVRGQQQHVNMKHVQLNLHLASIPQPPTTLRHKVDRPTRLEEFEELVRSMQK